MLIKCLVVGMIGSNCYVVGCEKTKQAVVIDPGGEGEKILKYVDAQGLQVKYIINTHGHIDHIGANEDVRDATGAKVLIHEKDAAMLTSSHQNMSMFIGKEVSFKAADKLLTDGDTIEFGEEKLQVIHTPGHTKGGISLAAEGVVFTGDTLFNASIGRTDFEGGNYETIINSIKTKLMSLPDETAVYPGHMGASTIGFERKHNPFLS